MKRNLAVHATAAYTATTSRKLV